MRIDAHQQFTPQYSPCLLAPILKRNRFDATVLIGGADWEGYAEAEIVRAVVVALDLANPGLPRILDRLERHPKFRGVAYGFEDGLLPRGLEELARRDLTLDLPPRPALATAIAERFPALRMALNHVGRPSLCAASFDDWARDLEIAALHPGLHVKVSGLITDAPGRWRAEDFIPTVRHALRIVGPERTMYGSDWPAYLPEGTWKEALAAFTQSVGALPMEVREHLLGGTAARFYATGS